MLSATFLSMIIIKPEPGTYYWTLATNAYLLSPKLLICSWMKSCGFGGVVELWSLTHLLEPLPFSQKIQNTNRK